MNLKPFQPLLIISFLTFLGALVYTSCNQEKSDANTSNEPLSYVNSMPPDNLFTGEPACQECHEKEVLEWKGSHHDKAMMMANEKSVLADFDNSSFTNKDGMHTRFYKKGQEYWVNTQGPDGGYYDYKVVYTFGFTPLQQYIVEFPNGKYQCLSTAWDTIEKKWFDLYPTFHVVPSEWLHQSRGALTWNTMCADCHSTNLRKNYFEKADSFNTQYSIINVSCEACHGPAAEHIKLAKELGDKYHSAPEKEGLHLTSKTTAHDQVDQCARCHSRREQLTLGFNHQGSFLDHYYPRLLNEGAYHGDGQIMDEVYVYGSFVQSKMYMNNVKCTDCHNPHSMHLKLVGNALCLQCHQPEKFNAKLHTFHEDNSEGSQCINCHMSGKLYMVNDYRRDHSFRIPRPDLSMMYGSPNACNDCHSDKSPEWAYDAYKNWYGPVDSIYYTDILSMARTGNPAIVDYLVDLTSNVVYPPLVRATGIDYLSRFQQPIADQVVIKGLNDKEPLVRAASLDALNEYNLPSSARDKVYTMLTDEKRSVRIKAFEVLAAVPASEIPVNYRASFDKAKSEYLTSLEAIADFSGGQAEKGIYYQRIGNTNQAIVAYLKALEIDNQNNPARNNLANLYYEKKEFDKAEDCFRTILSQEPEHGQTYYSLGLLLSEKGEYEKAVTEFEMAVKYLPDNPRIRYNLGLIYQSLQQFDKSEKTFIDGLAISPGDESLLYAMVYYYNTIKKDYAKAKYYTGQLVQYYPNNPDYRAMLKNYPQ